MDTIDQTNRDGNTTRNRSLASICVGSCQKLIERLEKAKNSLLAEFSESITVPQHLLRLALTEAEALAWQTGFPQLVFPALAMEKAQAVAAWDQHQRAIRSTGADSASVFENPRPGNQSLATTSNVVAA